MKPRLFHHPLNSYDLSDPSRFTFVETLEDGVSLYTAVVWSVSLKRRIRLAYLRKAQDGVSRYVVLFSSDTDIDPLHLYRGYAARFQIEFIFRDARQFTGLADGQARSPDALDSHINASLMALSLAKAALLSTQAKTEAEAEAAPPVSLSLPSNDRPSISIFSTYLPPCSTWSQL